MAESMGHIKGKAGRSLTGDKAATWQKKRSPVKFKILLLKSMSWVFIITPLIWIVGMTYLDQLGGDPAKEIQHFTGRIGIRFLLAVLLLSPLVHLFKWRVFNSLRRLLGLAVFFWAVLHVLSYLVFELRLDFSLFLSEIISRNYLILGATAWIGLFLLALTSNKWMMKQLKRNWKRLHNCVYPIAILIAIHYFMSQKIGHIYPLLYLGTFIVLWGFHFWRRYK